MATDGEKAVIDIEGLGRFDDFVLLAYSDSEKQDVTDHPVESGGRVVDNLDPKPRTIEIEIALSGMGGKPNPYQGMGLEELKLALQTLPVLPEVTPYLERLNKLKQAKREGRKLKLVTERGVDDNLVIAQVDSGMDKRARSATVSLSLQEIPTVETQVVVVPEVQMGARAQQLIGRDDTPDRHGPASSGGRALPGDWGGYNVFDATKVKWSS